ncbi:MAG: copper resistance protein NlpE [Flavobacteriaceae bacterium]|jgi:uncharacterized lipoprotein NlpE involved in copper resistance|nr:copper resistance protein NlpE [Flavobacteriaceae bacterium]
MIKKIFYVALSGIFVVSCDKKQAQNTEELNDSITVAATTDTVENKPLKQTREIQEELREVAGIYKGTLPCADCEGIETQLVLEVYGTYILTHKYLGKKDTEKPFEYRGKYALDKSKNEVVLDADKTKKYAVKKDELIHLDEDGNVITGELAPNYILKKILNF